MEHKLLLSYSHVDSHFLSLTALTFKPRWSALAAISMDAAQGRIYLRTMWLPSYGPGREFSISENHSVCVFQDLHRRCEGVNGGFISLFCFSLTVAFYQLVATFRNYY